MVYLERTVPEQAAIDGRLAPFASVELAPAKIGEDTFWLPTMVYGTFNHNKVKGSFEAHYSDFHRYTASITILPGVTETDTPHRPLGLAKADASATMAAEIPCPSSRSAQSSLPF